jgi:hypothetical protein
MRHIATCLDDAPAVIKGSYPHGSFGSGKSHPMAVLG